MMNTTFDIVLDNVHKRLHCCGLTGTSDFKKLNLSLPISCLSDNGVSYELSCLDKFRSESLYKARIFAICIYMMGVLTFVSFLINLILLREFFQDRLLEHVIERLTNFSNMLEPLNETKSQQQNHSIKPEIQKYIIDYLLESNI